MAKRKQPSGRGFDLAFQVLKERKEKLPQGWNNYRTNFNNAVETVDAMKVFYNDMTDFLEEKGLANEFNLFHAKRELDRVDVIHGNKDVES